MSQAEARRRGAFTEDALTEADAVAGAGHEGDPAEFDILRFTEEAARHIEG